MKSIGSTSADPTKKNVFESCGVDYLFYKQLKPRPMRRVWFSLDSAFYFSTGKDSDGESVDRFENFMGGVPAAPRNPLVDITRGYNFMLHHEVSYGLHIRCALGEYSLEGVNYDTFSNVGLKFRPIVFSYQRSQRVIHTALLPKAVHVGRLRDHQSVSRIKLAANGSRRYRRLALEIRI